MNSILLKGVLFDGRKSDILVEGNRIRTIAPEGSGLQAQTVVGAEDKAILPALYNAHTHAAMTLLRGYADDMKLDKWLNEYIWPFEAKMGAKDIRKGSELAIREMVESGTVMFNDMYFFIEETIDLVAKSGMRAAIGITVMDNHSLAQAKEKQDFIRHFKDPTGGRIQLVMAPHAVYTVGTERLRSCAAFARDNGMKIQIHLSETQFERESCIAAHGMSPVKYLDSIGFLGPDVIAAHCVTVDDRDVDILAERGVSVAHCPCSNMKISSGRIPYEKLTRAGVRMTLGTDGASSNNNLDLREEMKFAALLAKVNGDPELLSAEEILRWATVNGAESLGVDAGVIAEGKLADFILVDLNNIRMQPCYNLVSNWVYSADSTCVSSVWCDGKQIYASARQ